MPIDATDEVFACAFLPQFRPPVLIESPSLHEEIGFAGVMYNQMASKLKMAVMQGFPAYLCCSAKRSATKVYACVKYCDASFSLDLHALTIIQTSA